jgi:hypothetical protein
MMNLVKQALADYQRGKRAREDAEAWEPRRLYWQTSEEYSHDRWERFVLGLARDLEQKYVAGRRESAFDPWT